MPMTETGFAAAGNPELAVLSAIVHGADPDRGGVLDVLPAAFEAVGEQRALGYYAFVRAVLPPAARRHLEALEPTRPCKYISAFARRHYFRGWAEGRAEGAVKVVLSLLEARGIDVSEDARTRIAGCTDLDQLDGWVRRTAVADSVADVLD